ncbi:MAG: hypothetical protein PHT54_03610 [Candidatus Nanoarchaeia archaeon]|nr:hypothetical protein [Candidatus Nanoarchaeia archaeon]
METIKIEVFPNEGTMFIMFRKYQDDFELLLNTGFFDMKNGECFICKENGKIKELSLKEDRIKKGKIYEQ